LKNEEPETKETSLPLTRFAQDDDPMALAKAGYWIKQFFIPYIGDLVHVRKHIIDVYADASQAMKHVKTGDSTYKAVPDWKTRLDAAHKMDEWYEKTINQIYKAAKQQDSPIDAKEFDALGPRKMVEDTYKRIRAEGVTDAEDGGKPIAS
jgi:hypothetical protein